MAIFHEWNQELWMKTPYGEALALGFFDYGPESDLRHLVIQQEAPHTGELWAWHNSEVRVLANRTSLRGPPASSPAEDALIFATYKGGGKDGRADQTG